MSSDLSLNHSYNPPVKELLDFSGRVVLVTGAGQGIGAGIARRFAEAGAAVAVHYRSSHEGAEAVAQEIRTAGGWAQALGADVTVGAEVEGMVAAVVAALGRLDVLVNNAGLYPVSPLLKMPETEWQAVVDANLKSVHLCTQAAARKMVEQKQGGSVVNIASIEGEIPAKMHSHYASAKAGVAMHTRAAALELGEHSIRVNAVSPGLVDRPGLARDWRDGVDRWRASAPLGRLGDPLDVADACLFLASPAARWITGANLPVDGGMLSRAVF